MRPERETNVVGKPPFKGKKKIRIDKLKKEVGRGREGNRSKEDQAGGVYISGLVLSFKSSFVLRFVVY